LRRVVKFLDGVTEEDAHALLSGNIDQWQFERFAADGASVAHIRFPADLTRAIVDCVMRVSLAYRAESSGEGRITARTNAKKRKRRDPQPRTRRLWVTISATSNTQLPAWCQGTPTGHPGKD